MTVFRKRPHASNRIELFTVCLFHYTTKAIVLP